MILYHGSPALFDRFDIAYARSGEGLQAYGSGMYVTDSVARAAGYASGYRIFIDGELFGTGSIFGGRPRSTGNRLLDNMLHRYVGDVVALLTDINDRSRVFDYSASGFEDSDFRALRAPVSELVGRVSVERSAYLYQVGFDADESDLVNADLPLEEQPGDIRALVEPLIQSRWFPSNFRDTPGWRIRLAISRAAKRGSRLEQEFMRLGYQGCITCREDGSREVVAYRPDELSILRSWPTAWLPNVGRGQRHMH